MTLKLLAPREESNWYVRVTLQIFHLCGAAFPDTSEESEFKRRVMTLASKLHECRDAQLDLNRFVEQHTKEVESGKIARAENGHIRLLANSDVELNRLYSSFIDAARKVLYHLFGQRDKPDSVTYMLLGRSISFVQVRNNEEFEKYAAQFMRDVPGDVATSLIDMLRGDRDSWAKVLIGTRNRIEHDVDCPSLQLSYGVSGDVVRVAFPTINGCELRTHLNTLWENLFQAVEETLVLCASVRMGEMFVPQRIPEHLVAPNLPFRWSLAFRCDPSSRVPSK
jgi:hypothetical protein